MSDFNPYAAPIANPNEPPSVAPSGFLPDGRSVEFGRGAAWVSEGYELFKRQPGTWIGLLVIYTILLLGVQFIPLVGWMIGMLMGPVFSAGIMLGINRQRDGGTLKIEDLFAGFGQAAGSLILLGLIHLAGMVAIGVTCLITVIGVGGAGLLTIFQNIAAHPGTQPDFSAAPGLAIAVLLAVLVFFALLIPLWMAFTYAPALIAIEKLGPLEAMRSSVLGSLKNILPMFLFGLVGFGLAFVGAIALLIGLLVALPTLFASFYCSYRDIYYAPPEVCPPNE